MPRKSFAIILLYNPLILSNYLYQADKICPKIAPRSHVHTEHIQCPKWLLLENEVQKIILSRVLRKPTGPGDLCEQFVPNTLTARDLALGVSVPKVKSATKSSFIT